ncbi:DUF6612 family protein [Oceanobacillus jeddahense]|uniref:DUF6612 family protein n=1 Tax=Oceanobacillus jeddahense TaxID=1462527 RepID=UPI00059613AD|nr:DUF6612 family protein [Oceanobacillus jeddahense]
MKNYIFGIGLIILLFLAGCSEPEASEILEEMEQVEQDMTSLDVEFEESIEGETLAGNGVFDFENNIDYYNLGDFALYKDNSDFLIETADGMVAESFAETPAEQEELEKIFSDQLGRMKTPFAFFVTIDPDIHNKFDIETRDEDYVLTYNGDEADMEELGRGIAEQTISMTDGSERLDIETSEMDIEAFALEMVIEKETHHLQQMEQKLTYTFNDISNEQDYLYTYSNHNDAEEIEIPAVTVEAEDTDPVETTEQDNLSEEERETLEAEASDYLDALIQATVFQDAEAAIDRLPDGYSEDNKQTEAEMQRDMFKEIYIQNTEQNMQGANIEEEDITDLADAVMGALSTTEYEIVDAHAEASDDIVVTISVEGISDTSINQEVEQELFTLYTDGEIEDDELDSKNIELLMEQYNDIDELLPPVELDVHVMQNPDGTYVVIAQDQYLAGFVQ